MLALTLLPVTVGRRAQADETSHYQLVDNWVHFPPEVTKWGQATGVDVDSHDNVFVFHRNELMPIMAFDKRGHFIRAWGRGLFKTTHFLRVDRSDSIWVTDRGYMQAFKFNQEGKLLLTLGKQDVLGDNTSHDTFNGMADLAVSKNGDIFIADGEGPNTRVAKFAKSGAFLKWWGGKGTDPGQFNMPHSIAVDSRDRIYVADRSNNRVQIFDKRRDVSESVDERRCAVGSLHQGRLDVPGRWKRQQLPARHEPQRRPGARAKSTGLSNPTAVAVDSTGAIYVGEVNGTNVKKPREEKLLAVLTEPEAPGAQDRRICQTSRQAHALKAAATIVMGAENHGLLAILGSTAIPRDVSKTTSANTEPATMRKAFIYCSVREPLYQCASG